MAGRTFDIEDLSQVIHLRSLEPQREDSQEVDPDDLSLPLVLDDLQDPAESDPTIEVVDSLTRQRRKVYRADEGRFLRYRVGVLGIGSAVESVHDALRERLSAVSDLLVERVNLWAKYEVGLFGGQPRRKSVTKADAEFLADRLAAFRPNYLVLVNAGHVRNHFADKSPQQLAVLTRHINLGALAGQRPYTLILVVDRRIPDDAFAVYWRTCQMMNTFPAAMQFTPSEVDQLVEYARLEVERYTSNHLVIQT
ncbi:MAG: hypothetical protein KC503_13680 [Myxococcales bacterium]|nr:hypothetical protein [Myxococcales bacterium]